MLKNTYDHVRFTRLLTSPEVNFFEIGKKLAEVYPYTFMELADDKLAEVKHLLRVDPRGNFIAAIKKHRELFQSDLKTAKDACDLIRRNEFGYDPDVTPVFSSERYYGTDDYSARD